MTSTIIPFNPSLNANFQFQCTLDGAPYNVICTFNPYGQRYYITIYDLTGQQILSRPLIASPSFANVSLTLGYFETTMVFRESSQVFEIPGIPPVPLVRPPKPAAPPIAKDPYWLDVVLLLQGQGANGSQAFIDSSSFGQSVSGFGTAEISTVQKKFGTSSIYLFGPTAYLEASAPSLNLEGGDYTIQAWAYLIPNVEFTGLAMIYSSYQDQAHGRTNLCISAEGALIASEQDHDGFNLSQAQTADGIVSFNAWHLCTLSKVGTTMYLFLDGVLVATAASPVRSNWTGTARIGRHAEGGFTDAFYGYVYDIQVTAGVGRYTSDFALPTAPFPTQ